MKNKNMSYINTSDKILSLIINITHIFITIINMAIKNFL